MKVIKEKGVRSIALLLAFVLMVGLLPLRVFAESPVQARWGLAVDGSAPSVWQEGTLAEAMTYANALTEGTTYVQLAENIDKINHTTWPLTFNQGKSTILDLNGKIINRGLTTKTKSGHVIVVNGTVTLIDSSTSTVGAITGGYVDGSLTGMGGGGVYVSNTGSFTMLSGSITQNTSTIGGGGVQVDGTFLMEGGSITKNQSQGTNVGGGGVLIFGTYSYSSSKWVSGGNFDMRGGLIAENKAASWAGGVDQRLNVGSFSMTGGSITGNECFQSCGGVFFNGNASMGGTAVIKDNYPTGYPSFQFNVLLYGNIYIDVTTPFASGAQIGVTTTDKPETWKSISITTPSSADYSSYFFSDLQYYAIENSGTGNNHVVKMIFPVKPAAPTVTADDANNTIIGLNLATMEYSLNGGSTWSQTANPDLTGDKVVQVRIKAQGAYPASNAVTLRFTVNPVKPAVPSVTVDDASNSITGLDLATMEYSLDGGSTWSQAANPDLSGNKTIQVRVKAQGATPASDAVTLSFTAASIFAGGDGTALNPYQITNAAQLSGIRDFMSSHFMLMNDITLDGEWTPIGDYTHPFSGSFDGQGFVISNLTINQPVADWLGLFGRTSASSAIADLGLSNVNINGSWIVGGLVGDNSGSITNSYSSGVVYGYAYVGGLVGRNNGTISNSHASGTVTATSSSGGGLVGQNNQPASISNSHASGLVNGDSYLGGLVGENYKAVITNSYSSANVEGIASSGYLGGLVGLFSGSIENSYATGTVAGFGYLGGLVGEIYNSGTITNTYATGLVTGTNHLGGLVGNIYDQATISKSYASGAVTVKSSGSGSDVGGLIGSIGNGVVSDSFYDIETTGQAQSAGGEGKSTQLMKKQATFVSWDFAVNGVWSIKSGSEISYPYLQSNSEFPAPGLEELSYSARVTINKDDSPWISGTPTIKLSSSSTTLSDVITMTSLNGVYTFENLLYTSTYYIWEDSDSGSYYTRLSIDSTSKAVTLNYYTLQYDGHGSTGGSMSAKVILENTELILDQNTFEKLGYIFMGWNTAEDGSGVSLEAEASYTMPSNQETLYAQWTPKLPDTGVNGTTSVLPLILGLALLGLSHPLSNKNQKAKSTRSKR